MTWLDSYAFREPLDDLRGDDAQAEALAAELLRGVARGHLRSHAVQYDWVP